MDSGICFSDEMSVHDITVLSGTRPCGRSVEREKGRKNNGFLYLWEGSTTFADTDGRLLSAGRGDLVFLPKGKIYRMTYDAPSTTFVLVNFELTGREGESVCFRDVISVVAKDDASFALAKIFMKFEQCSAAKNISSFWRRKELFYRLFGVISASFTPYSGGVEISGRIVEGVHLLEQTYLENLPISTLADACHLSVNRFRELFQKQFGTSPVKYRNRLRIERARELLSESDMTISEVAYAAGFENVGYFYRCYQKEIDEKPAETKRKSLYFKAF